MTSQDDSETLPIDGKRILIVDDEAFVREAGCAMLGMLGYEVQAVESAEAAKACLAEAPSRFDLVLIDLNMPDMAGDDCFRMLKQLDPTLRAAIISGSLTDDSRVRRLMPEGLLGMIQKPFTMNILEEEIAQFLSAE